MTTDEFSKAGTLQGYISVLLKCRSGVLLRYIIGMTACYCSMAYFTMAEFAVGTWLTGCLLLAQVWYFCYMVILKNGRGILKPRAYVEKCEKIGVFIASFILSLVLVVIMFVSK